MTRLYYLFVAMWLGACAHPMEAFYKSLSTTASVTMAGYGLLAQKDREAIRGAKSQDELKAWGQRYDKAAKVLDVAAVAIDEARTLAPQLADRPSNIAEWISKLITIGLQVADAMAELGIRVKL